jgi:acyl-CoA thioesterase
VPDLWPDLLACLDVVASPSRDAETADGAAGAATYEGRNQQLNCHQVFGGQLLANGRSFGRGDVVTRDGVLVASYAQEALLRFPTSRAL